jgi:hypothetical protein
VKVRVLSPRPPRPAAPERSAHTSVYPRKLVVLANGKSSAEDLLERLPDRLDIRRKPVVSGPAAASLIDEIAGASGRCLVLLGD